MIGIIFVEEYHLQPVGLIEEDFNVINKTIMESLLVLVDSKAVHSSYYRVLMACEWQGSGVTHPAQMPNRHYTLSLFY